MFNLTDSPEFMAALRQAMVTAARGLGLGGTPAPAQDPQLTWLTTQEAMRFLRTSPSAFQRFRHKHATELRVSHLLGEPRYQLASLQGLMQKNAKGGTEPELPLVPHPAGSSRPPGTDGKRRGVSLRVV